MSITLKQLSRIVGVHPSTVARVLHNDPRQRVSEEVRERILRVAQQYEYRPNSIARSLRTKRSAVLGALIPDISNPFFANVFRGMEDAVAEREFSLILANTDDLPARELRGMAMLRDRQVDGLLLATARRTDPAIEQLIAERVPFVLVNRHTDPILPNAVVLDDFNGGKTAVNHLIELGHRRIAHIAGPSDVSTGYLRSAGYLDALTSHGIAADPALCVPGSYRESGGFDAMNALLALSEPPTAVFAVNDLAAIGAMHAIFGAGLRVPDDISVIGYNDLFPSALLAPQLTTMQVPHHQMGVRAAELLLAIITEHFVPQAPVLLPVSLVVRQTTGHPNVQQRTAVRRRRASRPEPERAVVG